jgi:flavodoxin
VEKVNALVVYDSQYGNTEFVARVIAGPLREFGEVRISLVQPADLAGLDGVDLLVAGSPTQGWRPTPAMQSFLEEVSPERLHDLAAALFDTHFRLPRWMTGSAADVMEEKLREKGISLLLPPESFFVKGRRGSLRNGELERAAAWARVLLQEVEAPRHAAP